jgi:hypothetical protein
MARDYKKEYANYHSKPEQKKKRAMRNKARADAVKDGRARKGDGKDVHHKKPLRNGGSNAKSNTAVVSKSRNRADNGGKGGRKRKG